MRKLFFIFILASSTIYSFSQEKSSETFRTDSSLVHASVSLCVADAQSGDVLIDYNSGISLTPASVMKVITTAAALELLGPSYRFNTKVGYSGTISKTLGRLKGNIIILGGGDPALGSKYFTDHYKDFIDSWVAAIKKLGVKRIKGKVITDDSYYDYLPVPAKWLLEDEGNYYGAGAFGVSVFDNTYEIHFNTFSEGSKPEMKEVIPVECRDELSNFLVSSGNDDNGNIFKSPYGKIGWIAGRIPVNQLDFILKASIGDPPLLLAKMMTDKLKSGGVRVSGNPATARLEKSCTSGKFVSVIETGSPLLSDIIKVLNCESINLFAEHLTKELGKKFKNNGSTEAGTEVIYEFLRNAGVDKNGIFIEDGSGLSPLNAVNTRELVRLLVYMKNKGKYFDEYYASFPDAGKTGTLKNYFRDPVFNSRLKAKSGSMTRVRSFAGYFTTKKGKDMVFSIIINNFSGSPKNIISEIEDNIRDLILNN